MPFLVIYRNIFGKIFTQKKTQTPRGSPAAGPPAMVEMVQWLIRPCIKLHCFETISSLLH